MTCAAGAASAKTTSRRHGRGTWATTSIYVSGTAPRPGPSPEEIRPNRARCAKQRPREPSRRITKAIAVMLDFVKP